MWLLCIVTTLLSIHLSIPQSTHTSIYPYIHLPIHLHIHPSIHPSIYPPIHPGSNKKKCKLPTQWQVWTQYPSRHPYCSWCILQWRRRLCVLYCRLNLLWWSCWRCHTFRLAGFLLRAKDLCSSRSACSEARIGWHSAWEASVKKRHAPWTTCWQMIIPHVNS